MNSKRVRPRGKEQIALWTFHLPQEFGEGKTIKPERTKLEPSPSIQMYNQDIDDDGKSGVAFVDSTGQAHHGSRAISWKDIKASGPDAELHLRFHTLGWEKLALRFDYRAESARNFDVAIAKSEDDDEIEWERLLYKEPLNSDYLWHQAEINLHEFDQLNDASHVLLRLYNFDRTGNDRLIIDNVGLVGTRINGDNHFPTIAGLPDAIASAIEADNQPPFHIEGGYLFHVSDPSTPLDRLEISVQSLDEDVVAEVDIIPVDVKNGVFKLNPGIPQGKVGLTIIRVIARNPRGNYMHVDIPYGASPAPEHDGEVYYSGISNVSAGVDISDDWFLAAVDEDNILRVYPRQGPSEPLEEIRVAPQQPHTHPLYLTHVDDDGMVDEMDIEAAARIGNRVFWMCSHSHNDDGELRDNRCRLFATDLHIHEGYVEAEVIGYYAHLRDDLTDWGDKHGYNFTQATAIGKGAKEVDGFNIEGFAFKPGGTTAYIGFRVPHIERGGHRLALVAPIHDFVQWFNNGNPLGPPRFEHPIELDLGGRGIRAMQSGSHGFFIVAGPADEDGTFALFTWSGDPDEAPQQRSADLSGMRPEAIIGLPDVPFSPEVKVQLLSDNGDTNWYDTDYESDDLIFPLQKFRSDLIAIGDMVETTPVDED